MAVDGEFMQRLIVQCQPYSQIKRTFQERPFATGPEGVISIIPVQSAAGPSLPVPYIVYGLFYSRYFAFYYFRLAN